MCISCQTIRNPKLDSPHFLSGVDPSTLIVPCGHCEDCKASKRQGIYVRLYYEYKECLALGGYCINLTLTYAPKFLPHVNVDGVDYPCFNSKDIQNYVKRVRKHFTDKNVPVHFTYFCAMELGGKTHRPHYHMLFFVKSPNVIWTYFKLVVRDKWQFGFTSVGRLGALVRSPQALNYAAKYVAKDAFEDSWYLPLVEKLKEKFKYNRDAFNYYKRSLSGRFLASRGLGLYCLSDNEAWRLHKLECLVPGKDGFLSVPLPLYLDRKLHYDVVYRNRSTGYINDVRTSSDDVPTYILNRDGMYYIKNRFTKKLDYLTSRLKEFINTSYTNDIIENACYSMLGVNLFRCRSIIRSFNLERLAAYQILYLHRRDYGLALNDDIEVTVDNMLCDFMTAASSSYRYYLGEEISVNQFRFINSPCSNDLNVTAYRQNAASMHKEFRGINANFFSFVSYYLSQCHKVEHDRKVTASKAYVYRKSLRETVIDSYKVPVNLAM